MKNLATFRFVVVLLACALLTGCIKRSKGPEILRQIHSIDCCGDYSKTQNNVRVCVKRYTETECKEVFGTNLLKKNIQPYQISIRNNTNDLYVLYPSYIKLQGLPLEFVAPHIKKSLMQYIAPIAMATWYYYPLLIYLPIQMGLDLRKKNKRLVERLGQEFLTCSDPINIYPWTLFEKFVFVEREDTVSNFYIRVYNNDKHSMLQFDVDLDHDKPMFGAPANEPSLEQLAQLVPESCQRK